jgi:hypothetical protein
MVRALPAIRSRLPVLAILALGSGCTMVPRSQVADCQRTAQTLRAENARLKDQLLTWQTQNRDYAERAVDDYRRLAAQEETIARLEESNHAYRNDRDQIEAAFKQLKANLLAGDLGANATTADTRAWPTANARSASAGNRNAAPVRSGRNSRPDDDPRVR